MSTFEEVAESVGNLSEVYEQDIGSCSATFELLEDSPFSMLELRAQPARILWTTDYYPCVDHVIEGVDLVEVLQTIVFDLKEFRAKMRGLGYTPYFDGHSEVYERIFDSYTGFRRAVEEVMQAFPSYNAKIFADDYDPLKQVAEVHGISYEE